MKLKSICSLTVSFIIFALILFNENGYSGEEARATVSEVYVSTTTGSDITGDGSQGNPWATIEKALASVYGTEANPFNILVAQGTYHEYELDLEEYVSIYGGYNPLTWARDINGYPTIVDGSTALLTGDDIFYGADYCTLDGLVIQNAPDDGVYCYRSSPTVTNCHILNCSGCGVYNSQGGAVIRNNIFEGNRYGIYCSANLGLTTIVENNLIISSISYGIYSGGNIRIINNTIDVNNSDGIHFGSGIVAPVALIQNNNITRSRFDGIDIDDRINAGDIIIRYNNVWGQAPNYDGQAVLGEGDISADPNYLNPLPRWGRTSSYDYHLSAGSPSNDRGTNHEAPSDDLDGNTRPRNGVTDIGCYETPPIPTPTPTPPFDVRLNSNSLAVGEAFTVDVTVPPINQPFDAWGVIRGPGVTYSFVLNNTGMLKKGAKPLITGVSALTNVYSGRLYSLPAIPAGAVGDYSVIVGLVSEGVSPTGVESTIPGYVDQEEITVGP